ncbi:hypothetical protein L207DRAFT_580086 [Hyaloscypha variabilis F]|uniref:2EXR domain-containing protein n=1 Tax=Hyaloscypha variabilis (strain UAMH 11265 / GT02V1 / F) TaxID=1149755 RepID=A0A2J6RXH9_HYAVF|nr:hypothetical protein L207DRAFT_580086 [Hyaloscypha variabilis F]
MECGLEVMEALKVTNNASQLDHLSSLDSKAALEIFQNEYAPRFELRFVPSTTRNLSTLQKTTHELRIRVWSFCLPRGRLVRLSYYLERTRSLKHPITLQVSHGSRVETLRHYRLLLKDAASFEALHLTPNALYFDPAADTLSLNPRVSFWWCNIEGSLQSLERHKENLLEAQHLTFAQFTWLECSGESLKLGSNQLFASVRYIDRLPVCYFPRLKKLDSVVHDHQWHRPPFLSTDDRDGLKKLILGNFERRSDVNSDFPIPEITIEKPRRFRFRNDTRF